MQVACVNPAAVGGGLGYLKTYWPAVTPLPIPSMAPPPPAVSTPWLFYPRQYTATCESADNATWLQVTPCFVEVRQPAPLLMRSRDLHAVTTSKTSIWRLGTL